MYFDLVGEVLFQFIFRDDFPMSRSNIPRTIIREAYIVFGLPLTAVSQHTMVKVPSRFIETSWVS